MRQSAVKKCHKCLMNIFLVSDCNDLRTFVAKLAVLVGVLAVLIGVLAVLVGALAVQDELCARIKTLPSDPLSH